MFKRRRWYTVIGLGVEENKRWEQEIPHSHAIEMGEKLFIFMNFIEKIKFIKHAKNNGFRDIVVVRPHKL